MTEEVHYKRRDGIAVLTLDRPVGNVLAPGLRADLKQQLEKAIADEAVTGIVLNGAGSGFSSGVDITEYEGPLADPWVGDICNLIELGPKPVVAALHGAALGGGFELALAAHARVAASGTRVALGDVNLGLIPGGGATQRAPRLVGAQVALEFMLSGKAVDVANPRMRRFFDRLTENDPLEAAIELAASLAASGRWGRTRDQMRGLSDAEAYQKAITSAFERTGGKDGAKNDIVKCVQAAQLLPIESGLVFERTTFEERLRSDDARGQLHIFAAERRAAIMPELAKGPGTQVRSVALTGIAPIVPELVIAFWDAGLQVHLASADTDGVRAMVGRIHQMYKAARDDRLSNLAKRPDPAAADGVDVVLDCGGPAPEGDQPKMKPEAIRVTLEGRQGETDLAVRVYRPANTSRLVEVILPEAGYRREDVASLVQMFKKMGRTVVRSARRAGGAGHAMANALYAGALSLVEAGHTPYEVDETARRIGFASGPFELMDKEGLPDVLARLRKGGFTDHLAALTGRIDKGATGYAAGRGFYEYAPEGPRAIPQLLQRVSDPAQKLAGVSAGAALLAALANAAARLLTEDVVQRATDLDVIMVKGYGFARAGGGPLLQSDLRGAFAVLKDMKALSGLSSAVWAPHPLIENMVKNGEGFFGRASGMG